AVMAGGREGRGRGEFNRQEAVVDRVPEEDPRVAFGDDDFDSRAAQRPHGVFARRAAAEIVARDDEVARLDAFDEGHVNVFHRVFGQFRFLVNVQITRGYDFVRVDVRAFVNVRESFQVGW